MYPCIYSPAEQLGGITRERIREEEGELGEDRGEEERGDPGEQDIVEGRLDYILDLTPFRRPLFAS